MKISDLIKKALKHDEDVERIDSQLETIVREKVNVNRDYGAVGDGIVDDTEALKNAIIFCKINNKELTSDSGSRFLVREQMLIDAPVNINFNNSEIFTDTDIDILFKITDIRNKTVIKNIKLDGNDKATKTLYISKSNSVTFDNVEVNNSKERGFEIASEGVACYEIFLNDIRIYRNIRTNNVSDNDVGLYVGTSDCHFNNIVIQNYHTHVRHGGVNFYKLIHGWNGLDGCPDRKTSVFMELSGGDAYIDLCYADSTSIDYKVTNNSNYHIINSHSETNINWTTADCIFNLADNVDGSNIYLENCDFNHGKPVQKAFCNKENKIKHSKCGFKGIYNIPNSFENDTYLNNAYTDTDVIITGNKYDNTKSRKAYITLLNGKIKAENINGNFDKSDLFFKAKGNAVLNIQTSNNLLEVVPSAQWTGCVIDRDKISINGNDEVFISFKYKCESSISTFGDTGVKSIYGDGFKDLGITNIYKQYNTILKFESQNGSVRIESNTDLLTPFYIKEVIIYNITKFGFVKFANENDSDYYGRIIRKLSDKWFEGERYYPVSSDIYLSSYCINPYTKLSSDINADIYSYKNGLRFDKKSNVGTWSYTLKTFQVEHTGFLKISKRTEVFNEGSITNGFLDYVGAFDVIINGIYQPFINRYDTSAHSYKVYKGDTIRIAITLCKGDTSSDISFYIHDINLSMNEFKTIEKKMAIDNTTEIDVYKNGELKINANKDTVLSYTFN